MLSPYKRIKEDIIKPWELTDQEKDSMVRQISKLRQNWTDFESYVLGTGRLAHLKLYRPYQLVDVQWIIQYSNFEPDLQDFETFLRRRLSQYDAQTIELFVHNRKGIWTTSLICYFNSPFYIPEDYLEYEYGSTTYRPKFKPIYKIDKYISTITSERPHAQRRIQFLQRFDPSSKPNKMLKRNEEITKSNVSIPKIETLPVNKHQSQSIEKFEAKNVVEINDDDQEVLVSKTKSNERLHNLEQEFSQMKDLLSQFIKIQQEKLQKDKNSSERKNQKKKKMEEQPETPAKQSGIKEQSEQK